MVISLPSRTAAIIPHPHEQKLHEVVNSLTLASFNSCAAALTLDRSMSPSSASPTLPPSVAFSKSLRLMVFELCVRRPASAGLCERPLIPALLGGSITSRLQ